MNREEQRRLDDIQYAIDAQFSGMVQDPTLQKKVLGRVRGEIIMKKKMSFALALMLAIMFLLMLGTALASHFGLLDYLLGTSGNPASYELLDSIQPLEVSGTLDNVKVNVTGGLYDGKRFSLSWTIENNDASIPVLVDLETVQVNGEPANADNITTNGSLIPFPRNNTVSNHVMGGGMRGYVDNAAEQDFVEISLSFKVTKPLGELVVVDESIYVIDNNQTRIGQIEEAGIRIAGPNELEIQAWVDKGFTVLYSTGRAISMVGDYHEVAKYYEHRPNQYEEVGDIQLTFQLDSTHAKQYIYTAQKIDRLISNDGFCFKVNELSFTPLSTIVDIECWPEEGAFKSLEEIHSRYESGETDPWIMFADSDGAIIDYVDIGFTVSWFAEEQQDKSLVLHMQEVFPGLIRMPSYLVIFPDISSAYDVLTINDTDDALSMVVVPLEF